MTDIYIVLSLSMAGVALFLAKYFLERWAQAENKAALIQKDRDAYKEQTEHLIGLIIELTEKNARLLHQAKNNLKTKHGTKEK